MTQAGRQEVKMGKFLFCPIQALKGLDDAHPHRGKSTLLNKLIQRLMSSTNTLSDTSRNEV